MTTATAPQPQTTTTVKPHPDGGTYIELAYAPTGEGWGISITRWATYRNVVRFEVHRVSPEFLTLRLDHFGDEAKARAFANKMYFHDK
jgi:hypothetical protein